MPEYRDRVVQVLSVLEGLPTIPRVIHEILRLSASDRASASQLAELIAEDQSLAARVLRIANSAYFGHMREIATVPQAVVLIGFGRVRNAALAVAAHHALSGGDPEWAAALWRHSLVTSELARALAEEVRAANIEQYAVAGLLHDIGKLALDNVARAPYLELRTQLPPGAVLLTREAEELGITHAEVGSRLLIQWNLPAPLAVAAARHHAPERGAPEALLTSAVHVASAVANRVPGSSTPGGNAEVRWLGVSEQLGLGEEMLAGLERKAVDALERAQHFLRSLG